MHLLLFSLLVVCSILITTIGAFPPYYGDACKTYDNKKDCLEACSCAWFSCDNKDSFCISNNNDVDDCTNMTKVTENDSTRCSDERKDFGIFFGVLLGVVCVCTLCYSLSKIR